MRKTNKALVLSVVLTMFVALVMGTIVNAYTATNVDTTGSNVDKLDIKRDVKDVTNPVTVTFGYTVIADSDNPAGGASGLPTVANVVFNNVAPTGTTATVTKTDAVDFSGVTFSKLGVYKFKIVESSSTDATNYPVDATNVYYATVVVTNDVATGAEPNGNLKVVLESQANKTTATAVAADEDTAKNSAKDDIEFESDADSTSIEVSKTVTGTAADMDKYFKVTVTLPGNAGDSYEISGASSDSNGTAATSITLNASKQAEFYLKHGQTAHISGVAVGKSCTVAEEATTEYTENVKVGTGTSAAGLTGTFTTVAESTSGTTPDDNKVAFTNNYEQPSLTGIFIDVLPFIILLALAVFGMYAIRKTSNRD